MTLTAAVRPPLPHRVLMIPGYTGSGPHHWQTLWQRANPDFERVEQADWDNPERESWVAALDARVRASPLPCVLVAHSLGCITVAQWTLLTGGAPAAGAMLVAPADADRKDQPYHHAGFAPVPLVRLPFPSLLVASRNDPVTPLHRARVFAAAWGSDLHEAGDAGHIASKDGFGPWPHGRVLLEQIRARL